MWRGEKMQREMNAAVVDQRIPRAPDNLLHAHNGTSVKHFATVVLLLSRCYFGCVTGVCMCAASSAKSERVTSDPARRILSGLDKNETTPLRAERRP